MRLTYGPDNSSFAKQFWKGFWTCIAAAAVIATCLVIMGLVTYYSRIYGW